MLRDEIEKKNNENERKKIGWNVNTTKKNEKKQTTSFILHTKNEKGVLHLRVFSIKKYNVEWLGW